VIHRTMGCNCMRMGESSDCCMGDTVEVVFNPKNGASGNTVSQMRQMTTEEYEELLCQQIGFLVSSVEVPPTMQPVTDAPSPAPQQINDKSVSGVTVEEGYYEEEKSSSLGAGAIVGILFAIFVPLCGGCFILARQRKMEEEKRLREFAGEAAREDPLKNFDAMNEKRGSSPDTQEEGLKLENEEEIVVNAPVPAAVDEVKEEPKETAAVKAKDNDESEDDDSVWSDGDDKKDEKELIVETDQEAPQSLVGSALAALGVASTVATSMISPTNSKKEGEEEDTTKVNALV
jgi:hypothetical protein